MQNLSDISNTLALEFAKMPKETLFILAILLIWSLTWKGFALYRSAKLGAKWWFIVILLVNTVGILEIIYLFLISRKREGVTEN